MRPELCK